MDINRFIKNDEEIAQADTNTHVVIKSPDATGHTNFAVPRADEKAMQDMLSYVGTEIKRGRWAHVFPKDNPKDSFVIRNYQDFQVHSDRIPDAQQLMIGNLVTGG